MTLAAIGVRSLSFLAAIPAGIVRTADLRPVSQSRRRLSLIVAPLAAALALGLSASPALANMAACTSAAVKDDPDDQIRLYTICLEGGLRRGDRAGGLHNRAVAYMQKGEIDLALADLNRSLEYDDEFGLTYFNRAQIYLQRGEPDLALADLERAVTLRPSRIRPDAYRQIAMVKTLLGDHAGAIDAYGEAIERDGRDPELKLANAWLLATTADESVRDGAAAEALAQDALRREDSARGHAALAAAYAAQARFEDAVREQALAIEMGGEGAPAGALAAYLEQYRRGEAVRQAPPPRP
jgi:tetratricopeptide (TPR) repeat protein